jgi:hypothetical protein
MSVTLDFVREYRAGQAAEGKHMEILLAEMVPGDGVILAASSCRELSSGRRVHFFNWFEYISMSFIAG